MEKLNDPGTSHFNIFDIEEHPAPLSAILRYFDFFLSGKEKALDQPVTEQNMYIGVELFHILPTPLASGTAKVSQHLRQVAMSVDQTGVAGIFCDYLRNVSEPASLYKALRF